MKLNLWMFLYNLLVVPLLYAGFTAGSLFNEKIREGRKARRKQFTYLQSEIIRAQGKKRVLFHCTSAGEWLQAVPIIEKIKSANPELFIMVSFFSPSGYKFARNHPQVDLKFYLPLDSKYAAYRLFKLLAPRLWIISKFDIWPNHIIAAFTLKIPIVITSATLSADSKRDKGISERFNKYLYARISHFFPISRDDQSRFIRLAPDNKKYTIAGDTRYDHVFNRWQKADEAGDVPIFSKKRNITFIAGSTWPADERHILQPLARICSETDDMNLIIVPHELHENHLADIEKVFLSYNIETKRYTDFHEQGPTQNRVVIFNTIGLLARLYKQTNIAFIGGSFDKGTHNVMEPAVFSQPVLFGPHHLNSYEAGELLKKGAAFSINNAKEFEEKVRELINNKELRIDMGKKAKDLITGNTGATDIIINKLNELYGIIS